jgi:hypothetical protein
MKYSQFIAMLGGLAVLPTLLGVIASLTMAAIVKETTTKPFCAGFEYTYMFNTQMAIGVVPPGTSAEPGIHQQQMAVTRLEANAIFQFITDRHVILKLEHIRFATLNDVMLETVAVQPMHIFEPKQIPVKRNHQLQLPAEFNYVDGIVEGIQFHQEDVGWSKNIKRAVLNMIQLNLQKKAQGLQQSEQESNATPIDQQEMPEGTQSGEELVLYFIVANLTIFFLNS